MSQREVESMVYTINPKASASQDITRAAFPTVPALVASVEGMLAALNEGAGNFCAVFVPTTDAGPRGFVLGMHADAADGNTAEERAYLVTPASFSGVPSLEVRRIVSTATWTCGPNAVTAVLGAPSATHKFAKVCVVESTGWLESLAFLGPGSLGEEPAAYALPYVPGSTGYLRVIRKVTGTGYRPTHMRYG